MNRKLKQKIKTYAGFAGVLITADKVNAQVVYVDVSPDTLVQAIICQANSGLLNIDVNGDGFQDFQFMAEHKSYTCGSCRDDTIKIIPINGNKVRNGYYMAFSSYSNTL